MRGPRPESEFLALCARSQLISEAVRRVRSLAATPVDWEAIREMSFRHGVEALVYQNLRRHVADITPNRIASQLAASARRSSAMNLVIAAELVEILKLFGQAQLRPLCLKGPVLALSAYGGLALRRYRDIDLLLPRKDVAFAARLLMRRGYAFKEPSPMDQDRAGRDEKDVVLIRDAPVAMVELHSAVSRPSFHFSIDFDQLWDRRETHWLLGERAACLGIEDQLITLCAHGTIHCWASLKWICDIAELVRVRTDLDWSLLLSRASEYGGRRMLLIGLALSRDLGGATLPDAVNRLLAKDVTVTVTIEELSRTFLGGGVLGQPARTFFYAKSRERLRDRFAVIWEFCKERLRPNERDREALPLPGCLAPLHYAFRPLRVFWTHWHSTVQPMLKSISR